MAEDHDSFYPNPTGSLYSSSSPASAALISSFHQNFPNYAPTPLTPLPSLAAELNFRAVYLKDESYRFGLPSFKILGASWGAFRALARRYELPLDSDLEALRDAVAISPVALYAATDGNHGRAVARFAHIVGANAVIYVPTGTEWQTITLIESEGAEVVKTGLSYDEAVMMAFSDAGHRDGVVIQDTAFEGYEEVPQWIVEGYSTMLREIDEQLQGISPDLLVAPVGVGSFAQAVVTHAKAPGRGTKVLTVEPENAACLHISLHKGQATSIQTTPTIMRGMDCGTVSSIAWPVLSAGVNASLTVSEHQAHVATRYLEANGIDAGACGGATVAAVQSLDHKQKAMLEINEASIIVLLCTEGGRNYQVPCSSSP